MAERLESFDFDNPRAKGSGYPWDEWLNGDVWKLRVDSDIRVGTSAQNFRTNLYAVARKRGIQVQSQIVDDGYAIVIQALVQMDEESE